MQMVTVMVVGEATPGGPPGGQALNLGAMGLVPTQGCRMRKAIVILLDPNPGGRRSLGLKQEEVP